MSETVVQVLNFLLDAYPDKEVSAETMRVYLACLQDVDPTLLKTAVIRHVASSKWFPTVSELRESATAIVMDATGDLDPNTAWGEVTKWFSKCGRWGVPQFTSPVITQAVAAIGGWMYLCNSENLAADRARFIQAYTTYQTRRANDVQMLPAVQEYTTLLKGAIQDAGNVHQAITQVANQKALPSPSKHRMATVNGRQVAK